MLGGFVVLLGALNVLGSNYFKFLSYFYDILIRIFSIDSHFFIVFLNPLLLLRIREVVIPLPESPK